MFGKNRVRWGILLLVILIGLGMLYNHHRNSKPLEPVIIYKYTEPPVRSVKSEEPQSEYQEILFSDSEPEVGLVETLPSLVPDTPENDVEFEVFPEVEVDVAEFSESVPEEEVPFDFKTTPEGFPLIPYWDRPADRQVNWTYDHKLVMHVLVKLWRQGVHNFGGGSIDDTGRVRPHYTNTLYVEWDEATMDDGTKQEYISSFVGPVGVWRPKHPFDLPPRSVHLIDMNSPEGQGIDPYTFLTSTELP